MRVSEIIMPLFIHACLTLILTISSFLDIQKQIMGKSKDITDVERQKITRLLSAGKATVDARSLEKIIAQSRKWYKI